MGHEHPASNDVAERRSAVQEDRLDVVQHGLDLGLDGAFDDAAVPNRDLSGNEDEIAAGDDARNTRPTGG
jgi:hypothetical protein